MSLIQERTRSTGREIRSWGCRGASAGLWSRKAEWTGMGISPPHSPLRAPRTQKWGPEAGRGKETLFACFG